MSTSVGGRVSDLFIFFISLPLPHQERNRLWPRGGDDNTEIFQRENKKSKKKKKKRKEKHETGV